MGLGSGKPSDEDDVVDLAGGKSTIGFMFFVLLFYLYFMFFISKTFIIFIN